jgi:GNAT superfamily N-acetyltransferase
MQLKLITEWDADFVGGAYQTLLAPSFPDPNDLDDLSSLKSYFLRNRFDPRGVFCLQAIIATGMVVGVTIFSVIRLRAITVMKAEYTAVAPQYRGFGLGRQLCESREIAAQEISRRVLRLPLDLSLLALADPAKTSARDTACYQTQPRTLEKIWRCLGHRKVDFDCIQLPLAEHKNSVRNLSMWIKGWSANYFAIDRLSALELHELIDVMNHYRCTARSLEAYPEYEKMVQDAYGRGSVRVQ